MAELVAGAFLGAAVSAALTAVIDLSKKAWRCPNECTILRLTVESAKSHVEACKDSESTSFNEWLQQLKDLLDEAKVVMEKYCVSNSKRGRVSKVISTFYKKKSILSLTILDINDRIKSKIGDVGSLIQIHQTTLATYDQTTMILEKMHNTKNDKVGEVESPSFYIPRKLPRSIVSFENDPFQELKSLILLECDLENPPKVLGLIGCGRAGKTLIAQMLHNDDDIKAKYGKESILWVTVGRDGNLSQVYKKMGKFLSISIDDEALEDQFTALSNAFEKRRILLILDDVWDQNIECKSLMVWLNVARGKGSTTLVTTRSRDVLRSARVKQSISISLLSQEESWRLFCSHAFGSDVPSMHEIGGVAKQVCAKCGGLPLVLEVIGASLYGKGEILRWKNALDRLSNHEGEDKILEKLGHSYKGVGEKEQKLFLYFAAFPEDYEISTTLLCSIWHVEQSNPSNMTQEEIEKVRREGMAKLFTLADRSLIKLSEDGEIATIHDILRELAMDIILKANSGEYYFHPGKALKGLPLPLPMNMKRMSLVGSSLCDPQKEFNQGGVEVLLLSGFHMKGIDGGRNGIDTISQILLDNPKLRFLDLSKTYLKELPVGIGKLRALMYLDLSSCSMSELPEGMGKMKALTSLDLSWCKNLRVLPEDIVELKAIQSLNLRGCNALEELPKGMGKMKALTSLDLSVCDSLRKLPKDIVELEAIQSLNMAGCKALEELPEGMGKMKALTSLKLSWNKSLRKLPKDIVELEAIQSLNMRGCKALEELPEGMGKMKALTSLDLSWCQSLRKLPKDIVELEAIQSLNLAYCSALEELPEGMGKMKALTSLDLSLCKSLRKLPKDIVELEAIQSLNLTFCSALEELPEGMGKMKALTFLNLVECESLRKLRKDIVELEAIQSLKMRGCKVLEELPEGMGKINALTSLNLAYRESLRKL